MRGALGRMAAVILKKRNAAQSIQKISRGYLGRKKFRTHRWRVKGKWAVGIIEAAWKGFKWHRTLAKRLELKLQHESAVTIQRVYRGQRSWMSTKLLLLQKRQSYGVLKVQCLYRRFKAVTYVDHYAFFLRSVRSVLLIQSVARAMLARIRVRFLRLRQLSAAAIQRVYRIHCAWMHFKLLKKTFMATNIQRVSA